MVTSDNCVCRIFSIRYTHDKFGHVVTEKRSVDGQGTYSFSYAYNTNNQLSKTTYPGVLEESYQYDDYGFKSKSAIGDDIINKAVRNDGRINIASSIGKLISVQIRDARGYESSRKLVHNGKIPGETLNFSFNDFGKIQLIEDNGKGLRVDFSYGPDLERWYSELSEDGTDVKIVVYTGPYEKVCENDRTHEFYYLDGNTIAIRENGIVKKYHAFTDNLGNILSVVDENGTKVFDASYDAWGKQTVTLNTIGLHRGYTGHEMLNEFDIINMNGRLYDPVLGRFFSPDNYVQMPDNSQSFNRYSYGLNNPLTYTDPSGNLFGIDDAILAFAAFNMASSMMQASFEGKSVWKAGALSLLSSAASFGIGELFKGATATFGNELLRAGAHGLASGVVSALDGGNFVSSFVSGAAASGMGSYAQSVDKNTGLMVASTTAMGGLVAWAIGGDFLQGAMQGMEIGLFNHAVHNGEDDLMGGTAKCEILPDGTYVAPDDLPNITVRMFGGLQLSTPASPIEKPLESVHPEFGILFVERAAFQGFFESISTMFKQETGGLKQWVRTGMSYSKVGGFDTKSIRWGSSPHYAEKIGNTTLRRINQSLRNKRIPIDNGRTADAGHFHLKWGDRNTNQWFYIRK